MIMNVWFFLLHVGGSPDMQVHDGAWKGVNLDPSCGERHARSISDVTHILGSVSKLMFFNVENPTGHYRLEMTGSSVFRCY